MPDVQDVEDPGHHDRPLQRFGGASGHLAVLNLLPVRAEEFEGGTAIPPEFIFEPNPAQILDLLIPRYVEQKVFHALLESSASEHAARQRAMKSATDNADEVITVLTRVMNQARQDQITTEISEIVGGAEALAAGRSRSAKRRPVTSS